MFCPLCEFIYSIYNIRYKPQLKKKLYAGKDKI